MSEAAPAGPYLNVVTLFTFAFGNYPFLPVALDVERTFHLCNISAKETNDRGDIPMKAIVVTDDAVGTTAMKLVERRHPQAAINDADVQVYASGLAPTERAWPSTWADRLNRDRTP